MYKHIQKTDIRNIDQTDMYTWKVAAIQPNILLAVEGYVDYMCTFLPCVRLLFHLCGGVLEIYE